MKRTPLRRISKKRAKVQRQRARMVSEELELRPTCEVGHIVWWRSDAPNICLGRSSELHEPLTRARGGSILDPDNTVAICRNCHRWIHDHPEAATELGLLKSQHEQGH